MSKNFPFYGNIAIFMKIIFKFFEFFKSIWPQIIEHSKHTHFGASGREAEDPFKNEGKIEESLKFLENFHIPERELFKSMSHCKEN